MQPAREHNGSTGSCASPFYFLGGACREALCGRLLMSHGFEKAVSHIGHMLEVVIVATFNFSPCVPFKDWACTSCATLELCVSENSFTSRPLLSSFCIAGPSASPLLKSPRVHALESPQAGANCCSSTLLESHPNRSHRNRQRTA